MSFSKRMWEEEQERRSNPNAKYYNCPVDFIEGITDPVLLNEIGNSYQQKLELEELEHEKTKYCWWDDFDNYTLYGDSEKGLDILKSCVGLKYLLSAYDLGYWYWTGKSCKKDRLKALEYFKMAAENGDLSSCIAYGLALTFEYSSNRPYQRLLKSVEVYHKVNESNPFLFHLLSGATYLYFKDSYGLPTDGEEVFHFIEALRNVSYLDKPIDNPYYHRAEWRYSDEYKELIKIAKNFYSSHSFEDPLLQELAKGCSKSIIVDPYGMLDWPKKVLEAISELGDSFGTVHLCEVVLEERESLKKVFNLIEILDRKPNKIYQYKLGRRLYRLGLIDREKYVAWIDAAIDLGINDALFSKAKLIHDEEKVEEAIQYYKAAFEKGNYEARSILCDAYESGILGYEGLPKLAVKKDHKFSALLYKRLNPLNWRSFCCKLANQNDEGSDEWIELHEMAAYQGWLESQYKLGVYFIKLGCVEEGSFWLEFLLDRNLTEEYLKVFDRGDYIETAKRIIKNIKQR